MELDRNLQSFQQAGVRAEYHPCDITVRENIAAVLESIVVVMDRFEGLVLLSSPLLETVAGIS
jgi:hypothetical protein